jgi:hypothetical protein
MALRLFHGALRYARLLRHEGLCIFFSRAGRTAERALVCVCMSNSGVPVRRGLRGREPAAQDLKVSMTARAPPTPMGGTRIGRSRPAAVNAASRSRQRDAGPIRQTASRNSSLRDSAPAPCLAYLASAVKPLTWRRCRKKAMSCRDQDWHGPCPLRRSYHFQQKSAAPVSSQQRCMPRRSHRRHRATLIFRHPAALTTDLLKRFARRRPETSRGSVPRSVV